MAVPTRIQTDVIRASGVMYTGGGTSFNVKTPNGATYCFFIDASNADPSFKKSLDGGMTWGTATALKACSMTQISVWYDRWSGIDADLIHVAYTDSSTSDVFYRNVDAANSDTLSTEYTVFAGSSTAQGGALSISRMRGGNLIVCGCIDSGTEEVNRKSTNVGVNWDNIAVGYEDASAGDLCIVMPGWGADNQDAMMFYYDRSATEISVKYYDDSADSWSEVSIATSITLPDQTSVSLGHVSATVDLTNSRNLLVFWTAIDTANADLRCFKVTQSAQTETTTNVVLNSTDDQGFCAISVFGSAWYVFYFGNSSGTETYNSQMYCYYKYSSDGGETWSSEVQLDIVMIASITYLTTSPISYKNIAVSYYCGTTRYIHNAPLAIPRATYQLGI
jgi:hypothetical protein